MEKRGGFREKAGRPKGSLSKRSEEAYKKAEAGGIMPMDVLLEDMRFFHRLGADILNKIDLTDNSEDNYELFKKAAGFKATARECAVAVSPYIHPRIASIEATVDVQNHELALSELE